MAHVCRQITGSVASCTGWVGVIIATATNDWVRTCDYTVATCIRMDELGSRGLWAECVISPALYHCVALNQILTLPAYIQTSRALMVCACLLGLPAMLLMLMGLPFVRLQHDTSAIKLRRARVGGVLILFMAVCGIVSTVWFPIGVHQAEGLMSFGFSLYAGWVGSALCLLGATMSLCSQGGDPGTPSRENSFYYSRQRGTATPTPFDPPANHAKSALV
ncbi:claudin-11b [Scomber scombrus]|uniref:Claudin n=1 Tax=Scomber scombrus TaxID=13677 RepID=A0AAV1PNZ7_SCOSC|nr:claudin-11b [Scomber scombrus]